jgi:hypothetical protein
MKRKWSRFRWIDGGEHVTIFTQTTAGTFLYEHKANRYAPKAQITVTKYLDGRVEVL